MPRGSSDTPNTGGHLCLVQSYVGKMKEDGLEKLFRCLDVHTYQKTREIWISKSSSMDVMNMTSESCAWRRSLELVSIYRRK